jgi:hypothetical protein
MPLFDPICISLSLHVCISYYYNSLTPVIYYSILLDLFPIPPIQLTYNLGA